jgi:hypothetical protein
VSSRPSVRERRLRDDSSREKVRAVGGGGPVGVGVVIGLVCVETGRLGAGVVFGLIGVEAGWLGVGAVEAADLLLEFT